LALLEIQEQKGSTLWNRELTVAWDLQSLSIPVFPSFSIVSLPFSKT
jgi:hypothetical protein